MSAHTPGPWAHMAGMPTNILGSKSYRVARCDFDGDFDHLEALANAQLIAAAPDLLVRLNAAVSALDQLTDRIDGTGFSTSDAFSNALDEIDLGNAAIAKATGGEV